MTSLIERLRGRAVRRTAAFTFAFAAGLGAGAVLTHAVQVAPASAIAWPPVTGGQGEWPPVGGHGTVSHCAHRDTFGNVICPPVNGHAGTAVGGDARGDNGGSGSAACTNHSTDPVTGFPICGVGGGGNIGTPVPLGAGHGGSGGRLEDKCSVVPVGRVACYQVDTAFNSAVSETGGGIGEVEVSAP